MKFARLWALEFVLVLLVVVLLVGCGGGTAQDSVPMSSSGSMSVPVVSSTTESLPSIPPVGEGVRYLDPIFGAVETVENVVYWPDAEPLRETVFVGVADLTMDIHRPAGDTETRRPVVVSLEDRGGSSWVVDDYVRRGYVVVTPTVRGRPSAPSAGAFDRTRQGMVDAAAAVRYLRANAEELGVHRDAIAATGYSGAGIVAMALAWGQQNSPAVTEVDLFGVVSVPVEGAPDFGDHLAGQPSDIAAVFPMVAWYPPELVDPGEPPALFFNGTEDPTYPFAAVEEICPTAEAVGVTCVLRTFATGHSLGSWGTLSVESARFLYEEMLVPLGVVDPATLPIATPDPDALAGPEPVRVISPESRSAPQDTRDVSVPDMEGLATGPDGVVYVATDEAIVTVDGDRVVNVDLDGLPEGRPPSELDSPRSIHGIATGPDGVLWVAGSSVSTADDTDFGGTASEGGFEIRRLAWIAARDCEAESCMWRVFRSDEILAIEDSDSFRLLAVGADGSLVAVGEGPFDHSHLLARYDGTSWTRQTLTSEPVGNSVAVGDDGVVWLAAGRIDFDEGGQLVSVDGATVTRHGTAEGLPGDQVTDVAVGADGTVWVVTASPYGVASLDDGEWTIQDLGDGAAAGPQSVAAGPDGTVWVTFADHYGRFDRDQWRTWPTDLPTWGDVAVASDGTLWRTIGAALLSFDGADEIIHPTPFDP